MTATGTAGEPFRAGRTAEGREVAGLLFGLLGVTIFGGTLPATRLAVSAFDPAFITVGRAAVAGTLSAVTLIALRRRPPPRASWPFIAVSTILLVAGFPFLSSLALRTAEATHGAVVLAVLPLATAAAGAIIGRERPSPRFWLFAVLGSLTVLAYVLLHGKGGWSRADGLFFLAALSAAFGYAFSGILTRSMQSWEVICWQLVVAMPFTLTGAIVLWPSAPLGAIPLSALAGFAYVSIFSMFLGFFAWNAGLALGGVARVGQLQLLQVFVTLAFSALLLGERLDLQTALFAGLVVLLVALGRRAR